MCCRKKREEFDKVEGPAEQDLTGWEDYNLPPEEIRRYEYKIQKILESAGVPQGKEDEALWEACPEPDALRLD